MQLNWGIDALIFMVLVLVGVTLLILSFVLGELADIFGSVLGHDVSGGHDGDTRS